MNIQQLNLPALYALGFDRVAVNTLQHVLIQSGNIKGATTLPQVAAQAITQDASISANTLAIAAINILTAMLDAEKNNLPLSNNDLLRRMDDMQNEIASFALSNADLSRRISILENGVI